MHQWTYSRQEDPSLDFRSYAAGLLSSVVLIVVFSPFQARDATSRFVDVGAAHLEFVFTSSVEHAKFHQLLVDDGYTVNESWGKRQFHYLVSSFDLRNVLHLVYVADLQVVLDLPAK